MDIDLIVGVILLIAGVITLVLLSTEIGRAHV